LGNSGHNLLINDEYVARPTLNIYYLARPLTRRLQTGDDAGAAAWFAPDALPQKIASVNGRMALETWASGDSTPIHLRGTQTAKPPGVTASSQCKCCDGAPRIGEETHDD
jgi:hypothetical protein